ncbi:MAG TPA: hypothetical protein PKW95_09175 [bacterium]|nr:hypothetical protein [bacterium]
MSYCTNCGKKLAPGQERCPVCAQKAAVNKAMEERSIPVVKDSNCPSCGAEMKYDPHSKLFTCPYCRTMQTVVHFPSNMARMPAQYLPFEIVEPKAESLLHEFLNTKGPFSLRSRRSVQIESYKRVYLPFWLFSTRAASSYSTRFDTPLLSMLSSGSEPATEPYVTDFPHLAYPAFPDRGIDRTNYIYLAPYDFSKAESLFAGALGEAEVEPLVLPIADAQAKAVDYIKRKQVETCDQKIFAENLAVAEMHTQCRDWTAGQAFAPAWEIRYRYHGEPYRMLINGQTGQVNGVDPSFVWTGQRKFALAMLIIPAIFVFAKLSCD